MHRWEGSAAHLWGILVTEVLEAHQLLVTVAMGVKAVH